MNLYFENTRNKKRYKVLSMDKANKTVTMQGELSVFTEPYDKARFEKLGYKLVREEEAINGANSRS